MILLHSDCDYKLIEKERVSLFTLQELNPFKKTVTIDFQKQKTFCSRLQKCFCEYNYCFNKNSVSELRNPVVSLWTSSDHVVETLFIVDTMCIKMNAINSINLSTILSSRYISTACCSTVKCF